MIRCFNNISLLSRNSFKVDVKAQTLVEFESTDDLYQIFSQTPPTEWYVLSGGNNILFTDDFNGTLLSPVSQGINIINNGDQFITLRVDAGVEWDDLVAWCVERNLWGIENLSLIPGRAGAAPIQNIGAYGVEASDVIESVEIFDVTRLEVYEISVHECKFAYRESIFKHELKGKVIITSIKIKLSKHASPRLGYADVSSRVEALGGVNLPNIRKAICEIRSSKLPDPEVTGNAGSFFKNPVVSSKKREELLHKYPSMPHYPIEGDSSSFKLAAGWLIDQSGLKGYTQGRVGIHSAQALVVINLGGATGAEIVEFAQMVQKVVNDKFGVEISMEVNLL
ncbi:MAG: UDP-N-acetylmuramate dehydrogenase [Rikenellaceae bacterium]